MIPKMKAEPRLKPAEKLSRGRKPVEDKKRPIRVWLRDSEIQQLGGEEKAVLTILSKLKPIL
jgi:hypothetical protein